MKHILISSLCLFFLCLASQAQSLDSLTVQANTIKVEYGTSSERYLTALNEIVKVANAQEDYETAYKFRKEYYVIVKEKFGVDSPEYADACVRMGTVSYRLFGASEGLKFYEDGTALFEKLGIVNNTYIGGLSLMSSILDGENMKNEGFMVREKLIRVLETVEKEYVDELLSAYIGTYPFLLESGKGEQQILYMQKAQNLIKKYNIAANVIDKAAVAFGVPRICYRTEGKYNKAIEAGKASQKFFADTFGEDCIPYAQYSILIGFDYYFIKDLKTCRNYLVDGINRLEREYSQAGADVESDEVYLPALVFMAEQYEADDDLTNANICRQKADRAFRYNKDTESIDFTDNLHSLYLNYSMTGQFLQMTKVFNELDPLVRKYYGEESDEYFRFITGSCDAFLYTYQKDKAIEVCDKVIALKNRSRSVGLFCKASVYLQFKEYPLAEPLLVECLDLALTSQDAQEKEMVSMCYNSLGYIYLEKDPVKAEDYLNKSIEYSKKYKRNNPGSLIDPVLNIGMIHYRAGAYKTALEYFYKALTYAKEDQNFHKISACLNNTGLCHMMNGDYASAISVLEQAKELAVAYSGTNSVVYAMALQNLSVYYGNLYEYDKCIDITMQVAKIFENIYGRNSEEYGATIHNLGIFHMYKNDYQTAAACYRESIRIHEALPDDNRKFISMSYGSLGQALFHLGDVENGEKAYAKSASMLQELGLSESLDAVQLLDMYGYSLLEKLNKRSSDFFLNAIATAENIGIENHPVVFHAQLCYGMSSLLKDGPFENYVDLMVNSLRKQYQNNFGLYNESEREQFWSRFSLLNDILFSCRVNDSNNGSLYDYLLMTKGMLLNTSTSMAELVAKSNNQELITDYSKLQNIRTKVAKLEQMPVSERPESVDSLVNLAEKIERRLISKSKDYGEYTSISNVTWEDIGSALKKNDVAVEFVYFLDYKANKDIYAALVLRKGWKQPQFVAIADAEVLNSIISNDNRLPYDVRINNIYSDSALYKNIWGTLEQYLNEGDNVYISASGILHNLSIEHLPDENEVYACDKYNIRRVSSTRDLAVRKNTASCAYRNATLFGGIQYDLDIDTMTLESEKYTINTTRSVELESTDTLRSDLVYLRGSEMEVTSISSILKDKSVNCNVLKGKEANEESFKHLEQKQNDIIHIATHGFYLPTEKVEISDFLKMMPVFLPGTDGRIQLSPVKTSMLRSGLVFAGGNMAWKGERVNGSIEDGIATSAEIANLNLAGTELVVLSACETGLGEVNDEGVFGLQRAFKKAGVNTIIMSLWKVSDHITQLMMTHFYTHLLNGNSKYAAFRKAQLEIRKEYPNPYQWAAYIMLD